jgi:hypothetical protein
MRTQLRNTPVTRLGSPFVNLYLEHTMMKPENKARIYSAIGALAFVVGGLLARATAIENVEKLEKILTRERGKSEDPRTPPPPATVDES